MINRFAFKLLHQRAFIIPSIKYYQSTMPVAPSEVIQEKIAKLEENQPFFDRLMFFDPDIMASLPRPLQFFDPVVEFGKDILVNIHDYFDLPWYGVLGLACIFARSSLLPLIYFQMKRTQKLATVIPAVIQMKKLIDQARMSRASKLAYMGKITWKVVRQQNLKWMRLFLYNLFHIPMLITIVWSIRRLLVEESFKQTSFLWIQSLTSFDPYYIVPCMTIACYYFNLQRFITPENKHTIPSKLRSVGQVLLILWLPFLCNWPSAIQLYMMFNAFFSIIQTTMTLHPSFQKFVDPKIFIYQLMVRLMEYDKSQSQAVIQTIKSGEETHFEKGIKEEELVSQMKASLRELEDEELQKNQPENIFRKF